MQCAGSVTVKQPQVTRWSHPCRWTGFSSRTPHLCPNSPSTHTCSTLGDTLRTSGTAHCSPQGHARTHPQLFSLQGPSIRCLTQVFPGKLVDMETAAQPYTEIVFSHEEKLSLQQTTTGVNLPTFGDMMEARYGGSSILVVFVQNDLNE